MSPQSEGLRYPEHLCSPGLGAGAPTSTKPPISAAAEMSGFCILYVQMHCLHRNKFTNYIANLFKETQIIPLSIRNKVSCALDLWDEFNLCPTEVSEYKKTLAENIEKTKVIEEIITNVNQLIFNYQPLEAQQLIESVLPKFPTDERLLTLRDKVKTFIVKQNEYFDNTQTRRKFPKPIRPKIEMNDSHTVSSEESTIESPSKKRKFPKVKRNN